MLKYALAIFAVAICLGIGLTPEPAQAFCVTNEGSTPLVVQAGGPPMPIYVKPNLMPGQIDCYVPRKPDGIMVEIFDGQSRQLRCRNSVPAKDANIIVGKTCRVKLG